MPKESHYAVMACATSPTAWYCWISPWLLGESRDPAHLIPLGPPLQDMEGSLVERIVVGHNVSFDRARVLEEYDTKPSGIRWIDTMALHVSVNGISSVQRPAWMAWNKERKRREEATQITPPGVEEHGRDVGLSESPFFESRLNADLQAEAEYQKVLSSDVSESDEVETAHTRWEAITSVNSLQEVAKLYCGIKIGKEARNAFMTDTPKQIRDQLTRYIDYCAKDVYTTHAVFKRVLPLFLNNCPHPVSWAGVIQMGSSFLTVNQEWENYLRRAEAKFRQLEGDVKGRLIALAEEARGLMESGAWKGDVFLEQLDWTPRLAKKSRGFWVPTQKELKQIQKARDAQASASASKSKECSVDKVESSRSWYDYVLEDPSHDVCRNRIIPILLDVHWKGQPMVHVAKHGWAYRVSVDTPLSDGKKIKLTSSHPSERLQYKYGNSNKAYSLVKPKGLYIEGPFWCKSNIAQLLKEGVISTVDDKLANKTLRDKIDDTAKATLVKLADKIRSKRGRPSLQTIQLALLDEELSINSSKGNPIQAASALPSPSAGNHISTESLPPGITPPNGLRYPAPYWPQWYWDLAKPRKDAPRGSIDITVRNRLAPLLLRLGWLGHPLFYSREHGWCYGVRSKSVASSRIDGVAETSSPRSAPVVFNHPDDLRWQIGSILQDYQFYKLPHSEGHEANVGNPLSKSFIKYAQDGTLTSLAKAGEDDKVTVGAEAVGGGKVELTATGNVAIKVPGGSIAKDALDMNAMCSYWISARDRVLNQMVVWEKEQGALGLGRSSMEMEGKAVNQTTQQEKWGMIIPQVITMGTVTRRAIEKTWLTASNAKKDRVGSELKAMVRAPPGYAIVGADVDSEELWISSVMGDAQFGMHGATAIGWMTLEGTKKAGTDLHSKTASILGISRDAAKVFNYSRIYGAGMRHAILLLLQANPGMSMGDAQKLAGRLYASTKGKNTHTSEHFGRKFWFGGTESYLFNKLEAIAHSDAPKTPALGCGITSALSRSHLPEEFGADYLPSRINWVVQSSGVDYLHLLITSMEHLIRKYDIHAKYMISVHDEVRYLVKEEDRYRAAMALQIANLWTRSLFAYQLELDDLPAGAAFFSAVDIDFVLRKEVDMPCVTPSQPTALPPGESLGILEVLEKTNNGSLYRDKRQMESWKPLTVNTQQALPLKLRHRAESPEWLSAQNTRQLGELKVHSANWGAKLDRMGRGKELDSWVRKSVRRKRERGSRDMEMIAESLDLPAESVALADIEDALSSGNL